MYTNPPLSELGSFAIVAQSSLDTVRFAFDASGKLVADNGMGLPMPDTTDYAPTFTVGVEYLPNTWQTWDIGTFSMPSSCVHPMTFYEQSTSGS
jgi:hypothetical protein